MITSTSELAERELTDAELAIVSGAGSSETSSQTIDLVGVDHIALSLLSNGDIREQVFFSQSSTGGASGS